MSALTQKVLRDALSQLDGWSAEAYQLHRTLELDDSQHADLTERVKVFADAMHLHPRIRRSDGHTQIEIGDDAAAITATDVALAARIEDAYRAVTSPADR